MMLAWLFALQASASSPPADVTATDFDLAKVRTPGDSPWSRGCRRTEGSEILVCGRRRGGDDYPYEEMERRYKEKPVRAEIGIGGGAKARVYVDQVELPQGQVSRRVMFGIKLPF